jgi:hypothetical protein
MSAPGITEDVRARLEQIADRLIPAAEGMPAASAVGVGHGQLDVVLGSRPDLADPLLRALAADPGEASMQALEQKDPEAHEALILVVLAGYYMSEDVKARLGYPGQTAAAVQVGFPEYVEEGLLDAVVERGRLYRDPEEGSS